MTILLTRTSEGNKELIQNLSNKNYQFIEFPLIIFEHLNEELDELKKTIHQYTLIITSKYSAILAAKYYAGLNLKAYVVGERSANILKENGFNILVSSNNINELLKSVSKTENLLYLRGNYITQELNFEQKEIIIYNSRYAEKFSDNVVDKVTNKEIRIITLFSGNSARALQNCIEFHKLENYMKNIDLYCFSKNIGEIFYHGNFCKIKHPISPNMKEFLQLFEL